MISLITLRIVSVAEFVNYLFSSVSVICACSWGRAEERFWISAREIPERTKEYLQIFALLPALCGIHLHFSLFVCFILKHLESFLILGCLKNGLL